MSSRSGLQAILAAIPGVTKVYYQPPESIKMSYPAIVYSRSRIANRFANNHIYKQHKAYEITVIDKNPDSTIVDAVMALPLCSFDRHFVSDNLNHDIFTIYY